MSAMGTTSYGYIENIDLYLGTGILFILLGLIIFVFKKDEKKYYIGGFIVFLIMMPFMKYARRKYMVFITRLFDYSSNVKSSYIFKEKSILYSFDKCDFNFTIHC